MRLTDFTPNIGPVSFGGGRKLEHGPTPHLTVRAAFLAQPGTVGRPSFGKVVELRAFSGMLDAHASSQWCITSAATWDRRPHIGRERKLESDVCTLNGFTKTGHAHVARYPDPGGHWR